MMSEKTSDKIVVWATRYKESLSRSYSDNAWKYFEYEDLKVHPIWNGYRCSKCNSLNSVKNKNGLCIKCLVIKEKIDMLDKILKELKQ